MNPYAHGEAILSVRFNEMDLYDEVDSKIRKLIPVRKFKDSIHFQIEGGLRRPPLIETSKITEFRDNIQSIAKILDIRVTSEHRWSSSDICFVQGDKYVLDGFGPIGQKEQDRSEYILRHSILERAALLAMAILDVS
jgi:D-alanine-D-alanine ligase